MTLPTPRMTWAAQSEPSLLPLLRGLFGRGVVFRVATLDIVDPLLLKTELDSREDANQEQDDHGHGCRVALVV